jgi:nucleolar protein 4
VNIPKVTPAAPSASESSSTEPQTQSNSKPLARGFAFVWFLSQQDAARAIEKVNGASLYAGYAADVKFANKSQIEGRRKIRKRMKSDDARVVAVDWALSKEKWALAQKVLKESVADGEREDVMDVDDEHDQVEDEDWTDESLDSNDSASASENAGDGESADGKDDVNDAGEHPPQPEEGSTLFIRNVPFEATDDELKTLSVQISCSTINIARLFIYRHYLTDSGHLVQYATPG